MKDKAPPYIPTMDADGRPNLDYGDVGHAVEVLPGEWIVYVNPHATGDRPPEPAPRPEASERTWPHDKRVSGPRPSKG